MRMATPNDDRPSKCSEESRAFQIAREASMTPEQKSKAAKNMEQLLEFMRELRNKGC